MKLLFSIAFLLLFIPSFACHSTTQGEVPSAVKKAFGKKYPGENDPDWHIDKNGNYEAKFKKSGIHYRADFTPKGMWVETETNIKKKDLPEAIKRKIEEDYDEYKIVEIELVLHHSKGTFYDVEFKIDGKKKDIEFNSNGKIIN